MTYQESIIYAKETNHYNNGSAKRSVSCKEMFRKFKHTSALHRILTLQYYLLREYEKL
jgi:hypothetical protein